MTAVHVAYNILEKVENTIVRSRVIPLLLFILCTTNFYLFNSFWSCHLFFAIFNIMCAFIFLSGSWNFTWCCIFKSSCQSMYISLYFQCMYLKLLYGCSIGSLEKRLINAFFMFVIQQKMNNIDNEWERFNQNTWERSCYVSSSHCI